MRVPLLVLVLVLVGMVGCVTTGTPGVRRNMEELTLEEIQNADFENAYDLVRTLRPVWLRSRGPTSLRHENPVIVYLDGTRMGGPEELKMIPRHSIERMKHHSPPEAQARWGLNHTNGAIEVVTHSSFNR